jgi:Holliday junction resolvase RusA-like endonuclease
MIQMAQGENYEGFKERRKRMYVLPGQPRVLKKFKIVSPSVFNPESQELIKARMNLDHQHNNDSLFYGSLCLDITFYYALPTKSKKSPADFLQSVHYYRSDLLPLIHYIKAISQGILYEESSLILFMYAKKLYDSSARTELCVTQLDKEEHEE